MANNYSAQLNQEQKNIEVIYDRLDEISNITKSRLNKVRGNGGKGSPTYQAERDSFAAMYEDRLIQLRAVQDRLVFGRLYSIDGTSNYIGRLGLLDENRSHLLTDWRADAARPFYEATAEDPMNIVVRRHVSLQGRQVKGIEDDVLDLHSPLAQQAVENGTLNGEGSLLASLAARRTSKMSDIVSTIQSEQDKIIRSPLNEVLVVQGGPGTGKTAVALHRAAYLLYTHRQRMTHSGVLIVGPSQTFLRYIEQVLPSLGETGVLTRTIGTLLPGFSVSETDTPTVAQLKGDRRMAKVIKRAIRSHIHIPHSLPEIPIGTVRLQITADDIHHAQEVALQTHTPHNEARIVFVNTMIRTLLHHYVKKLTYTPSQSDLDHVRHMLLLDDKVKKTLNLSWLPMTAEWLLKDLWAKPQRLKICAPWLSEDEISQLYRPQDASWTVSDIPLLDEAMELLGSATTPQQTSERAEAEQFAKQSLATYGVAKGLVDVQQLVNTMEGLDDTSSIIDQAALDRTWTFGHVVVDEAQELTQMEWQMLKRRCPSRSFTIVGDIAQTSALGGTRSWEKTMTSVFGPSGWDIKELTVDYRNPQEVATLASTFAKSEGLYVSTVTAARSLQNAVEFIPTAHTDELFTQLTQQIIHGIETYISTDGSGRIAVIASPSCYKDLEKKFYNSCSSLLDHSLIDYLQNQNKWEKQLDFITPQEAKGLEYDEVILINPGQIQEESSNHLTFASDLYVAITRATQKLMIMQSAEDQQIINLCK